MKHESRDLKRDILAIQKIINEITVTNAYSHSDKLDHALMMEIRDKLEKHRDELIAYRKRFNCGVEK